MPESPSSSEEGYLDGVKPTQEQAAPEAADAGAANPDSPDRDEGTDAGPKTMLEAVQDAVKPAESEEGESSGPKEKVDEKVETAPTKAEEKPEAGTDETKDDQLPFHKHPRWQQVQGELKSARPKAASFDKLQGMMVERGIAPDDVDLGIELAALIKHNPAEAVKHLAPLIDGLKAQIGETLPEDLLKAVDEGQITEELAKQSARERAAARQAKVTQERGGQEAAHDTVRRATATADALWTSWKTSDPDHETLSPSVLQGMELRILKARGAGKLVTPEMATSFFNESLTQAKANLRKLRPIKPEVDTKIVDSAGTPSQAKPSSMLEAIRQGAAGTYVPA